MLKQTYKFLALIVAIFALSGCSTRVTEHIPDDGIIQNIEDTRFPDLDDAWIKHGSFPNLNNLRKIRSGMDKDQIRFLVGHPHFSEGLYAVREWDYIFNFINEKDEVEICQYKIIFDKDMFAKSFFFKPKSCEKYIGKTYELIDLSADVLFDFDKWNLKLEGKEAIKMAYNKIDVKNLESISIVGHTDPLGSDSYNLALSEKRAKSVKNQLISLGIPANKLKSYGVGETRQVKVCDKTLNKNMLIKCLKPNRRVDLNIKYYNKKD